MTETKREEALEFAKKILAGHCKVLKLPEPQPHVTRIPVSSQTPFWIPTNPENLSQYVLDAQRVLDFAGDEQKGLGLNACGIDTLIAVLIAISNER